MTVYRPKALETKEAAAYLYAHGGYAVGLSARDWDHTMVVTTMNLNCVVFCVDYRLGPEVKCPTGQ